MADLATVRIDPRKVADLIRSPSGPVMRRLIVDGEVVKNEARRLVGVDTGELRDSIVKRIGTHRGNPAVFVGSTKPHALLHHEGTRAHQIVGRPLLVFHWAKVGRVVFARRVNHPGTRPNRYLLNALRALRARYN